MANHMSTYVIIENLNNEAFEKLKEIFNDGKNEYCVDSEHAIKVMYGENEYQPEYQWWIENIGAKWLEIEGSVTGPFEETVELYLTSAWSVPTEFLQKLTDILVTINDKIVVYGQYEDESLDPMGAFVYAWDYDDIEDMDIEIDFDKFWDEDEYRDEIYDMLNNHRELLYASYLETMNENN